MAMLNNQRVNLLFFHSQIRISDETCRVLKGESFQVPIATAGVAGGKSTFHRWLWFGRHGLGCSVNVISSSSFCCDWLIHVNHQ